MPTVQRGVRAFGATALTSVALVVVWVALTLPNRLDEMSPAAFLRLPVELLVLVALVLVLPERLRGTVAVLAGLAAAVVTAFKLLDIGFGQAMCSNKPRTRFLRLGEGERRAAGAKA